MVKLNNLRSSSISRNFQYWFGTQSLSLKFEEDLAISFEKGLSQTYTMGRVGGVGYYLENNVSLWPILEAET